MPCLKCPRWLSKEKPGHLSLFCECVWVGGCNDSHNFPQKTFSMVPFILMCHWIVSSPHHRNWRKNNILFSLFSHEPVTTSHVWVSEEMTDDATQGNLPLSFLSKYFFFRQMRGEERASTQQQLQINSFIINSHLSSIFLTHPLLYLECERLCDDFFPSLCKEILPTE